MSVQIPDSFLVLGGDLRMDYLAAYLAQRYPPLRWRPNDGVSALEQAIQQGSHLVFPVPFSRDGATLTDAPKISIQALRSLLRPCHRSLSGWQIPKAITERCRQLGILTIDWATLESVTRYNAVLTAEGAIVQGVLKGGRSLHSSRCCILGYGRCARALALRLGPLAGKVTIAARSPLQRALAQEDGFSAIALTALKDQKHCFDLLFNTIPATALSSEDTGCLAAQAVVLDLASGPLREHIALPLPLDGQAYSCPGLPGKYFPKDAGEILAQATLGQIPDFPSSLDFTVIEKHSSSNLTGTP